MNIVRMRSDSRNLPDWILVWTLVLMEHFFELESLR